MFRVIPALLVLLMATSASAQDFEVWLVDQSDSFGKTYGGTIYIYEGSHLNGARASSTTPTDVIDLSGATADRCLTDTGANPVRAHMLAFNSTHNHAILTFVASGHVVIYDARTRTPVACVRASAGVGGYPEVALAFGRLIRQHDVDLVALERGFIARVLGADREACAAWQRPRRPSRGSSCA